MDGAIKAILNQDRNSTCVGATLTCYNFCAPFILPLSICFYCWMGFLQKKNMSALRFLHQVNIFFLFFFLLFPGTKMTSYNWQVAHQDSPRWNIFLFHGGFRHTVVFLVYVLYWVKHKCLFFFVYHLHMRLNSQSMETSATDHLIKQMLKHEYKFNLAVQPVWNQKKDWGTIHAANILRTDPIFDSATNI